MSHPAPSADRAQAPSAAPRGFAHWLRRRWPLYLAAWLLFGTYLGINQLIGLRNAGSGVAAWEPLTWEISSVLAIMLLVPLVVALEDRFRISARPYLRTAAIHVVAALAFSLAHAALMLLIRVGVYRILGHQYHADHLAVRWLYELQKDAVTYLIVLGAIFAFREFRIRRAADLRASELAAEVTAARLRHLTAQVDPHFLFNSLNAISNRMHEDVEAADRMISQLSSLLRAAYATDTTPLVPLVREIQWLRDYAAMMGERFRGQLHFRLTVDPGIDDVQVPRLLLQPLVENGFKHGLTEGHGTISVSVTRVGDRLSYEVADDGVGLPTDGIQAGTGLSNIATRLELLFPGAHSFTISSNHPGGTLVRITFPASA